MYCCGNHGMLRAVIYSMPPSTYLSGQFSSGIDFLKRVSDQTFNFLRRCGAAPRQVAHRIFSREVLNFLICIVMRPNCLTSTLRDRTGTGLIHLTCPEQAEYNSHQQASETLRSLDPDNMPASRHRTWHMFTNWHSVSPTLCRMLCNTQLSF
jgi:hypothetical protein